MSLKRQKRKTERTFRKSKTSVLKCDYEKVTHMYFAKILEKRRLHIEKALMEKCNGNEFVTLILYRGQDVEQLPKHENKRKLANEFNKFFNI